MGTDLVSGVSLANTLLDRDSRVPVHLWDEAIIRGIGNDIGKVENWKITTTKERLRAEINGLLPLITQSTLEFDNGDEVTATLVYEKLEKHCKLCLMLDHEKENCPQNPIKQKVDQNLKEEKRTEVSKDHRTYHPPLPLPKGKQQTNFKIHA